MRAAAQPADMIFAGVADHLDGKEVMSCLRGTPEFHQSYNPDHTYRAMMKRTLTPDDLQGLTEETQP